MISAFASKTDLDLGFTVHHPIEGTYKKNPDGELFVYWTDDHNPPRVINITRQKNWLRSGVIESGPNQDQVISDQITDAVDMNMRWEYLYGIDFHETKNRRHKDLLNLFPSSGPVPEIQLQNINQGEDYGQELIFSFGICRSRFSSNKLCNYCKSCICS